MEAAALGALTHAQRSRHLDTLVMKGVMDFANSGRDDHFKEYAARASAECLIAFLCEHVDVAKRGSERVAASAGANGIMARSSVPGDESASAVVPPVSTSGAPSRAAISVTLYNVDAEREWVIAVSPTTTVLQVIAELRRILPQQSWEGSRVKKPTIAYRFNCYRSEADEEPLSIHAIVSDLVEQSPGRPVRLNVEWYLSFRGRPSMRVR
jgi:hypothetical protein